MFRFIHAADLHLDTPFEGISQVAPEVAAALQDASLNAWDRLVELALEEEVAFVVLAGDIYDGPSRGIRAQMRFLAGLEKLSQAGIHVFIAHGNHDPINGWSAISRWPEGVHIFGTDSPGAVPVERNGTLLAAVYGMSFGCPDVRENLALRFRRDSALEGGDGALHIGVLHCNVGNNPAYELYAPCSIEDLLACGMDYWALGHIHERRYVLEGNPVWIVYPGNTQGRSPKESEKGAKGALIVEAEGPRVTQVRFVPLDEVRFESVEVDISSISDLPGLIETLQASANRLLAENDGRSLILRGHLTGHSPLHRELARQDALEELLEALRDRARNAKPFLWWDRLDSHTAPEIDRDAIRDRGDLQSEVIRLVDSLLSDPEALERFYMEYAAVLDGSTRTRFLKTLEPGARRELLREAERLLLDLLQGAT